MPFTRIVGADVPVVLITYAGLAKVSGIVAFGVMLWIFGPWDTAIAEEISHRYGRRCVKVSKHTLTHPVHSNPTFVVYQI